MYWHNGLVVLAIFSGIATVVRGICNGATYPNLPAGGAGVFWALLAATALLFCAAAVLP